MTQAALLDLVAVWSERIGVSVNRVQIRSMRRKWGSISTAGTLTLSSDLLHVPPALAEYVVVHELLHLKFPDHRRGWRVSMGLWLPDWRERERQLEAIARQPRVLGLHAHLGQAWMSEDFQDELPDSFWLGES